MPDTPAAESQADSSQQPQAGNAESQADEAPAPESISVEEAKKLRSEAAALRRRAKDAEAELEKVQSSQMNEQERAIATARSEAREEAMKVANQRILKAEIKIAAAGKLQNPDLALHLLSLDTFEVAEDGSVDAKAIAEAIEDLLTRYPELAPSRTTFGTADGGVRSSAPVQPDMNALLRSARR